MGFYGQVFYELTDALSKIIVKTSATDSSPVELKAAGIGGGITMEPKIKWITLNGDANNRVLQFGHLTGGKGQTVAPLAKTLNSVAEATQLQAADTIAVQKFKYDDAGHVSLDSVDYYKLPISETETNIADLQNRMTILESDNTDQNSRLDVLEATFEEHTNSIGSLNERVATTEELIPKVATLEEASTLIGNRNDMTTSEALTITKAIGNMDTLSEQLKCNSLAQGVTNIAAEVNATNSSISNNALATKLAIKNLCNALAEQGITINYDSLWEV